MKRKAKLVADHSNSLLVTCITHVYQDYFRFSLSGARSLESPVQYRPNHGDELLYDVAGDVACIKTRCVKWARPL